MVNLALLHPAIQVSYMIMMYISVFPVAISLRRTNVYEEKSLGIYPSDEDETDENTRSPSYIGFHLRRQLSFDLWFLFLGLFIIAIAEAPRLSDPQDYGFQLWDVLFECVSAYGTVGLSMGYPNTDTSFSAQFNTVSKLVIVALQIRGRLRGLPYALDRAILLPSESLNEKEREEQERQMRRRPSNLSQLSHLTQQPSQGPSRSGAGMSTGVDAQDRGMHSLPPNADSVVQRQSTVER